MFFSFLLFLISILTIKCNDIIGFRFVRIETTQAEGFVQDLLIRKNDTQVSTSLLGSRFNLLLEHTFSLDDSVHFRFTVTNPIGNVWLSKQKDDPICVFEDYGWKITNEVLNQGSGTGRETVLGMYTIRTRFCASEECSVSV